MKNEQKGLTEFSLTDAGDWKPLNKASWSLRRLTETREIINLMISDINQRAGNGGFSASPENTIILDGLENAIRNFRVKLDPIEKKLDELSWLISNALVCGDELRSQIKHDQSKLVPFDRNRFLLKLATDLLKALETTRWRASEYVSDYEPAVEEVEQSLSRLGKLLGKGTIADNTSKRLQTLLHDWLEFLWELDRGESIGDLHECDSQAEYFQKELTRIERRLKKPSSG